MRQHQGKTSDSLIFSSSVADTAVTKAPVESPRLGFDGGRWDNTAPPASLDRRLADWSPPQASSAIWVLIAAIIMTFAAISSALIVRQGASLDWRHLALPRILYANTGVLLFSSFSLLIAGRRFASSRFVDARIWLYVTLAAGLLFVAGQWDAWLQLRSQGVYLATNPNSSFFYVLTVAHALHVIGGICGLTYVIRKANRLALRKNTFAALCRYWHFVDLLWIYLMVLLIVKI